MGRELINKAVAGQDEDLAVQYVLLEMDRAYGTDEAREAAFNRLYALSQELYRRHGKQAEIHIENARHIIKMMGL